MKFIVGLLFITVSLQSFAQSVIPVKPEACPSLEEIRKVGFQNAVSTVDPEDGWFVYSWKEKFGTPELWGLSMIVTGRDAKSDKAAIAYANNILYGWYNLKLYYGPDYWDGKYNLWNCKYQTDIYYHEALDVMTPPPDIDIFTKRLLKNMYFKLK
jgi:hypothetical protein